jgi:hypothetical protein
MNDWDAIYSYSRKQAIEDGILIDCTEMAKEAGFKYPTAITRGLWDGFISNDEEFLYDTKGKLWDVLMVLRIEAKDSKGNEVHFKVLFQKKSGKEEVDLWAVIDGGDDGKPVITILLEGED